MTVSPCQKSNQNYSLFRTRSHLLKSVSFRQQQGESSGWLEVCCPLLKHTEIAPKGPAVMLPEGPAAGVCPEQENVAFRNSLFPQGAETTGNQRLTDAHVAVCGHDGEVMKISAPPVVSGEYSAHNSAADARHETQSGIPSQITGNTLPGITVGVQADPRNAAPQREHSVAIRASHFPYPVFHLLLIREITLIGKAKLGLRRGQGLFVDFSIPFDRRFPAWCGVPGTPNLAMTRHGSLLPKNHSNVNRIFSTTPPFVDVPL